MPTYKKDKDIRLTQGQLKVNSDLLLTLDEASSQYQISPHTLRNWCQKNKLNSQKVKGRFGMEIRIKQSELAKFKDNNPELFKVISGSNSESTQSQLKEENNPDNNPELLRVSFDLLQQQLLEKDKQISLLLEKLTQSNSLALNAQNLAQSLQDDKQLLLQEKNKIEEEIKTKRKRFLGLF